MTQGWERQGSEAGAPLVTIPAMTEAQAASWHGLMDLYEAMPHGWTLVGGQMVHLHCAERGVAPERPTTDVDTVVDVRAATDALGEFTQILLDLGFTPDTSGDGLQHRWRRELAQVDVLLPDGVGARAAARTGAGGAPTIPTPGGTQALHRTEAIRVEASGRIGTVLRPNLLGALVMKAAAHTAVGDSARGRHRIDFVVLSLLLARLDVDPDDLSKKDKARLRDMVAACRADPVAMELGYATEGLDRLERAAGL